MEKTGEYLNDTSDKAYLDASTSPLIALLGHEKGWVRHHARELLVAMGESAVDDLMEALKNKNEDVRWEAAKALGQIGDVRAANALVKVLNDKNFGIRWLAAEALIRMGYDALNPLLLELMEHPDALWLRQGAHHVLNDLVKKRGFSKQVIPLLDALEGSEPALTVPLAAKSLLDVIAERKFRRKRKTIDSSPLV
jgi:HEAT repeat protein